MNVLTDDGLRHLAVLHPRAVEAEGIPGSHWGLTQCCIHYTWKTGPRFFVDRVQENETRAIPSPNAPTCLTCLWEKDQ